MLASAALGAWASAGWKPALQDEELATLISDQHSKRFLVIKGLDSSRRLKTRIQVEENHFLVARGGAALALAKRGR